MDGPLIDFIAVAYNRTVHRYEFTALVWDIANQNFAVDPDMLGDSEVGG